ncbi:MAG: flavodoxin domain-containing protein [Anaerolineales bacterium]
MQRRLPDSCHPKRPGENRDERSNHAGIHPCRICNRLRLPRDVSEAIADALRKSGREVVVQPVREVRALGPYRAVVLGAPLVMYRWHADARRFLARHRKVLAEMPVAVFALGPTHVPYDPEEWRDSRTRLDKALAEYAWLMPVALELFGGKFDPKDLRFPINWMAGSEPATDIRDWKAIQAWAAALKPLLAE